MIRSIRWTLLFWYALILILVIGTFGGLVYHFRCRSVFEKVDAELQAHALALSGSIEWEHGEEFDLELGDQYAENFKGDGADALYVVVWNADGRPLVQSSGAPDLSPAPPNGTRDRGNCREVIVPGPKGTRVLVGRGATSERRELAEFLSVILIVGAATLLLSFLMGWLLVSRVLRPIRRMTTAAERISGENRTERIDVGRTESELGTLARTLNGAFDRLHGAFERQTRFTADASHELRTPLSIVVSNAECGLRQDRSPAEYRDSLEKCLKAARRMTGVVEGLLLLARSDSGEFSLSREEVDLGAVVREAAALLAPLAEDSGITVVTNVDDVGVAGDADLLRNLVGNLLSNALRYNREGGKVDITLAEENGDAVLRVADTGVGIPADDLDRVFERFYRVDKARSREVGGSGLGLAIAKWIVLSHGGSVDLESEPGEGTTVTVRMPLTSRPLDS